MVQKSAVGCTFDVIGSIRQNSWSKAAGYGELDVWFNQSEMGKYSE